MRSRVSRREARTLKMKYKAGDTVHLVYQGRTFSNPTPWEVVGIVSRFLVEIREKGTNYSPSVIDVSMIQKATPAKE